MRIFAVAAAVAFGTALTGCATVFEGTSQEVSVVTNPPGASCTINRQGMAVGSIAATPATVNIRKSKYDIMITCSKPGYENANYLNHSGTTSTIAANVAADILLTGGLSSIVDSADGADNKYDSVVNLTLLPLSSAPAQSAALASDQAPYQEPQTRYQTYETYQQTKNRR
jgi:PEGA domain